jgi:hypothetical protein
LRLPHSLQHVLDRAFGKRELLCIAGAQHHIRVGPVLRKNLVCTIRGLAASKSRMLPESWYCALAVRLNECARPARQVLAFALGNLADFGRDVL